MDDIRLVDAVEVDTSSPSSSNLTQPLPLTLWTVSVSAISHVVTSTTLLTGSEGPVTTWHQVHQARSGYGSTTDQISLLPAHCHWPLLATNINQLRSITQSELPMSPP